MYSITDYTRRKAKKYNVNVRPSKNKLKKIDVFKNGVKIASVGGVRKNGIPYMDYPNYIKQIGIQAANKKRKAYLARHAREPKIKNGIYTPSFWADVLLW